MADEYASDAFIYMRERTLDYPTFDVDNHLYENEDAMTKFLEPEFEGVIKYIQINGRTKVAYKDLISEYIPNPTFNRVAPPGGSQADPQHRRAIPSVDAFFDPEPRLALMKDMGIDKALMWPTLASGLEERLYDDPRAIQAVVRALNRWMLEHWTYNYADAIYPTPYISLSKMDEAIEELQFLADNGAKIFLIRMAPVPTYEGRKSFALEEFDPFWDLVEELDIVVGMHSTDQGYQRYLEDWNGNHGREMLPFGRGSSPAFVSMSSYKSAVVDGCASIIGHGLAARHPKLKFVPTEFVEDWVRAFVTRAGEAYAKSPVLFDEDPVAVFRRNIFAHTFHEANPREVADLVGSVDNILWGSDFPHPEGLADPLGYSQIVEAQFDTADAAKIMGGNLARVMKVA
jgi:predicted TIM-barrel fold metal-dependent hydrolase